MVRISGSLQHIKQCIGTTAKCANVEFLLRLQKQGHELVCMFVRQRVQDLNYMVNEGCLGNDKRLRCTGTFQFTWIQIQAYVMVHALASRDVQSMDCSLETLQWNQWNSSSKTTNFQRWKSSLESWVLQNLAPTGPRSRTSKGHQHQAVCLEQSLETHLPCWCKPENEKAPGNSGKEL